MEYQRLGVIGILDGVQAQQHDGVVTGLDLAIDGGVELGQTVGQRQTVGPRSIVVLSDPRRT